MPDRLAASVNAMQRALDQSVLRSAVIAHNVANINTPGFSRSSVPFGEVLASKMDSDWVGRRTRAGHRVIVPSDKTVSGVVKEENTDIRMDENNVDIEHEMNELAKNTLYYNALVNKLQRQFGRVRTVLQEGR